MHNNACIVFCSTWELTQCSWTNPNKKHRLFMNQEAMYIETAAAYPSLRQEAADEAHVLARRGRRRTNRDDAGVCQQRRGLDRPDVDAGVGVPRSRAASCRWRRPVAYSPSARVTDLFATIKLIELDQVTAILQRRITDCSNSTNQLQGRKKTNAECSSSSSTNWLQDKKKNNASHDKKDDNGSTY